MSESLKTVMVVEDDLILNLVYKKYVRSLGFILVGQPISGKEAIETAKREKPDLIIMDIGLQGELDGIETIQEIRKFSDCPLIYLSANSSAYYKSRAKQLGYHEFLVKPVGFHDLKRAIDNLFDD